MSMGEGVYGVVAATGEPRLVRDVRAEHYAEWVPGIRSELCVPLTDGSRVIGVVDVESFEVGGLTDADLERLVRLAPQISLVISNARLLARERAMVARLRDLDLMKSDFVAMTSHELRSPLTSVRGFIRTLRRPDLVVNDQQRDEYLAVIDRQTERLSRLVE